VLQLNPEASGTPNLVAWLVLGAWPLAVLLVVAARRSQGSLARTTAWLMMLPVMLLPAGMAFKAPGVPALDKHRLSFLAIAVALTLFHPRPGGAVLRAHRFARFILLGLVVGAYFTVLHNTDALQFGPTLLPALTDYDAASIAASLVLDLYIPFAVGERVFRTEGDLRDLFEVLVLGALVYAPFCLLEVRFSPQLHYWVYGYYQHQFLQAMRAGGFRPVVFMNHGLSVAMFLSISLAASLAMARARSPARTSHGLRTGAIGALLLLTKSAGPIVYALVAAPLLRWAHARSLARVSVLLVAVAATYPLTRAAGVFPRREVVEFFSTISDERAESLDFRFTNEDRLLARARERPVFGWGTWGRSHVYAPWGQDLSVLDGYWIITLGSFGYVGFIGFFALLLVPVLRYVRHRKLLAPSAQLLVGALALLVSLLTVDLLPNARSDYLPLAYAGGLYAAMTSAVRGARHRPARRAGP